ncbi:hypothetical protein SDRG_10436 [Saprolegnia diclina VS20]|uniref:DUF4419 domain-containing protein n=1 Tax=Saprolegnia diclina (strain VS20) TaxID=1156394 RepID=T0Q262_SAPDV|nr:hypothetical protein SDRG_10436 [Saprolegnia diclina VS20]EQC31919.1 hypothetical protein SDRG_10436 [Saprolegnia diclina VS20]|eukprot:XP_008614647.1 hypothetical protein SDRG_10436 [Saprolegnia diclina VS20]
MVTFAVSPKPVSASNQYTTTDNPVQSLVEFNFCYDILSSPPVETPVVHSKSGFVMGVVQAYSNHHNLVLRPDDIWLAIMTQFGLYVNGHAEDLRHLFVRHEGQKELNVCRAGSMRAADFGPLVDQMVDLMSEHLVDPTLRDWVLPGFSTTTQTDTMVGSIVMMATMKKYFAHNFHFGCGIPFVTLLGTVGDWQNIRARVEKLATFDTCLQAWSRLLAPVLDQFVQAARGQPNVGFWRKICHWHGGSGPNYISGWLSVFCVIKQDGTWQGDARRVWLSSGRFLLNQFPIINAHDIPPGYLTVDVAVNDNDGRKYDAVFLAGHMSYGFLETPHPVDVQPSWTLADAIGRLTGWRDTTDVVVAIPNGKTTIVPELRWAIALKNGQRS